MKVSVIVPTYRRNAELELALNSIAQQTYQDLEIVLVDDNGCAEWNEKVAQVVYKFHKLYPQIQIRTIVNPENLGSARARNIGVMDLQGEFVTFLDDDDLYLPEKIQKQLLFMEEGGYDFSITDLYLYSEEGKLVDRRIRSYIKDTSRDALQRYHFMYHLTGTDTLMFRTEYIHQIKGFAPIDIGDEFYLMQRAIDGGGKFGYLPGCDVKAFVHTGEGGLSSGDGKIQGENALYKFKKSHFSKIDPKTRRYIRMRHYAVLAYAEARRKRYIAFLINAVKSFISAPKQCVTLGACYMRPGKGQLEADKEYC